MKPTAAKRGRPTSTDQNTTSEDHRQERACYQRLRTLVPGVPRSGTIAKVDLIHQVINYIQELEDQLAERSQTDSKDQRDVLHRQYRELSLQRQRTPLASKVIQQNNRAAVTASSSSVEQPSGGSSSSYSLRSQTFTSSPQDAES